MNEPVSSLHLPPFACESLSGVFSGVAVDEAVVVDNFSSMVGGGKAIDGEPLERSAGELLSATGAGHET